MEYLGPTLFGRPGIGPHFNYLFRIKYLFTFYYPEIGPQIKSIFLKCTRRLGHKSIAHKYTINTREYIMFIN